MSGDPHALELAVERLTPACGLFKPFTGEELLAVLDATAR
jgi:hypothetical protein